MTARRAGPQRHPADRQPTGSQVDWLERLSPRRAGAVIAGLLFVVFCAIFRDITLLGRAFAPPDIINGAAPLHDWGWSEIIEHKRFPLWCPYLFSGMPSFGSMLFAKVYPVSILLPMLLLGPLERFFDVYVLHYVWAGAGMALLCRSLGMSRSAALIGALAYTLAPYLVVLPTAGHGGKLYAASHMPWVVWAVRRALLYPKPRSVALAAAFTAIQLLSQHPQITFYTWLAVAVMVAFEIVRKLRARDPAGARRDAVWVGASAVWGLLLVAFFVLPVSEYAHHSIRGGGATGGLDYDYATSWSLAPRELLTFLVPSIYGFGGATYWGSMPFTDYPNYAGLLTLTLAPFAFAAAARHRAWPAFAMAAVGVLLAFGRHFPVLYDPMFHYFPYFSKFRTPVLALLMTHFGLGLLAALGLDQIIALAAAQPERKRRYVQRLLIGMGVGLAAVVLVGIAAQNAPSTTIEGALAPALGKARAAMAGWDAFKAAAFLVVIGAVLTALLRRALTVSVAGLVLTAILLIDVGWVDWTLATARHPAGAVRQHLAEDDVVRFLKRDPELFRIFTASRDIGANRYVGHRIANVEGYSPAKLRIYEELRADGSFADFAVLDMLNTKYIVSSQSLNHPRLKEVHAGAAGYVYRNRTHAPRAFLVDSVKVIPQAEDRLAELRSRGFDPRSYAIIERPLGLELGNVKGSSVRITGYDAHRVRLAAHIASPCLLVLSEVYYPAGWEAQVDGVKAPIWRANHVLRALPLGPGEHEIVFTFRPASIKIGGVISLVAWLGLLAAVLVGRPQTRKSVS